MAPGEHLPDRTDTVRVKFNGKPAFLNCFLPPVKIEMLVPAIEVASPFPGLLDHPAKPAVSPRKHRLQNGGLAGMIFKGNFP